MNLTLIRRSSLCLVFFGLLINGLLLVLAGRAGATRTDQGQARSFSARLDSKSAAEALVVAMKKDNPSVDLEAGVSSSRRMTDVPTGRYHVRIVLDFSQAPPIQKMLQSRGCSVVLEKDEGSRRIVRFTQVYTSKREAQAQVAWVLAKTQNVVKMEVKDITVKKPTTVWTVEVKVPDDAAYEQMHDYVARKMPSAVLEP